MKRYQIPMDGLLDCITIAAVDDFALLVNLILDYPKELIHAGQTLPS